MSQSNDGLASYSVSYRQSSSFNSAPLGIDIRVTPNDKNIMDRVARFLSPDEHTRTDFLFITLSILNFLIGSN